MPATTQVDTDLLDALDEFLEMGIKSGAFADLGGTSWNMTAEQEATILRAHLSRCQAGHQQESQTEQ